MITHPEVSSTGSMEFKRFLNRIAFILLALSLWLGWQAWSPRALTQYAGYASKVMTEEEAGSYLSQIKKDLQGKKTVRLEEAELNRFLNSTILSEQSYAVKPWVAVKGVFINFSPSQFSLCLEREVYEFTHQIEISHSLETEKSSPNSLKTTLKPNGGMIGNLKVPVRLAYNLSPWLESYKESLKPITSELKPYIAQIEIQQDAVLLHPPTLR